MKSAHSVAFASLLALSAWGGLPAALAQPLSPVPRDVVQYTASATVEARQDQLSVTLRATREGSDPLLVQEQLKVVLEAALGEARVGAQGGAMEVRSGNFSLAPRTGRDGRISA